MVRIKFSLLLSVIPHSPIQKYSITNSNIFSVAKNTIITPRDLKFKLFLSYMFCAIKQTLFFFAFIIWIIAFYLNQGKPAEQKWTAAT